MNANGVVTTCGNIASPDLPINVYPFILRGVTLVGIDSQNCPMAIRQKAWNKLSEEWQISQMETVVEEVTLDELDQRIDKMLTRGSKGRAIVNMQS
jgi:NADPH:quinone reductase-like Zn-dependent oxidoreductase